MRRWGVRLEPDRRLGVLAASDRPLPWGPRLRGPWLRWPVVAAAACVLLVGLGQRDLWEPDEPRIGAVAEELRSMRHGPEGLVLLHLAGEPYTQKPPLYYWMAALAGAPRGRVDEAAARLPSALAGIALVACTLGLGARLLGGTSGLLGAALLLSVFGFADLARRAQLDVLLGLFEWLALVAFWRLDRGRGRRAANLALLHGAVGLAILTKGPVGLLVPLLGFATYLAWERRLRTFPGLLPLWGLALSLGPALAWLAAAVTLAPAGFFGEAVGTNLVGRFFEGTSHARPLYYFVYQFPIEFLPWTLLWPLVWQAARREVWASDGSPERQRAWRLLLAWVLSALVFFSLSSGKRGLYLLPTLPAVALLCADAVVLRLRDRDALPRWLVACAAGLGALLVVAASVLAARADLLNVRVPWTVPAALALAVVATTLGVRRLAAAPALARFGVLVAGVLAVELAVFTLLLPALEPTKSPRPIAEAAAAITPPGQPLGLVGSEAKLGGLVYYSGRDVVALDDADDVERFLATGGRTLVVQAHKLDRIEAVTRVEVRAELREGRRSWLVVSPAPSGSGSKHRAEGRAE